LMFAVYSKYTFPQCTISRKSRQVHQTYLHPTKSESGTKIVLGLMVNLASYAKTRWWPGGRFINCIMLQFQRLLIAYLDRNHNQKAHRRIAFYHRPCKRMQKG
jgi:hypothetical protein